MDLNKAIKLLNLNISFNEEELRKSYRALTIKYHPDKYQNEIEKKDAEEMMKEINLAKTILEDYLKNKTLSNTSFSNSQTTIIEDLSELKQLILEKISDELKYIDSISELDKGFINYKEVFVALNKDYYHKIYEANDKNEVTSLYEQYRKYSLENLTKYAYYLWQNTKIPIDYPNLKNIKEYRENFISKVEVILEEELTKHKTDNSYEELEKLFNIFKSAYAQTCLYVPTIITTIITEFNKAVLIELRDYPKRKQQLIMLKYNNDMIDQEIIKSLEENIIMNSSIFDEIYSHKIDRGTKVKCRVRKLFSIK